MTSCPYPLLPSNDTRFLFKNYSRCSLGCKYPVSNSTHQEIISLIIRVLSTIGIVTTLIAILLFYCSQAHNRLRSKSPSLLAKVIKKFVTCQFIVYLGWSLQIFFNVACQHNGNSISGTNLEVNACFFSFLLTYLPSLSSLLWYSYLGKLCYEKIIGTCESQSKGSKDASYNIVSRFSYALPIVMYTTAIMSGQVSGNGLYGICSISYQSSGARVLFVFIPKIFFTLYGNYYFTLTVLEFLKLSNITPTRKRFLIRIIILAGLNTCDLIFSTVIFLHNALNQKEWIESIQNFLDCKKSLNESYIVTSEVCSIHKKPVILYYSLELISTLSVGVVVASWAFCKSNIRMVRLKLIEWLEFDNNIYSGQDPIDCTSLPRTNNNDLELGEAEPESVSMTNSLNRSISISMGTQYSRTARDVLKEMRGQVEPLNQSLLNGHPPGFVPQANFMPPSALLPPNLALQPNLTAIQPLLNALLLQQSALINPELLRIKSNFQPLNLNNNYDPPFVHGMVEIQKENDDIFDLINVTNKRNSL